jgi:hypothetical protein
LPGTRPHGMPQPGCVLSAAPAAGVDGDAG